MKPTLLAAVYYPIEIDGRVKRACAALAQDFELTLLCPRHDSAEEFVPEAYEVVRTTRPADGDRITRLVAFWIRFVALAVRMRPSVIHAHDFFLPLPGWLAARLCGARLVYDAHELLVPEEGEALGLKMRVWYALERFVVGRADLVIAANAERAQVMHDHYRLGQAPTVVGNVPPKPAPLLSAAEVTAGYPQLAKTAPGDVHLVYMGDISFERGIRVLLDALPLLPERVKLIFIGAGPDLETIDGRAGPRVRTTGSVPHAHLHDLVSMGDIGFLSYPMKGLNNILCAPNKVYEYAHAGLPMVATCQAPIRALFDEFGIGEVVGCGGAPSPEEVARAVGRIIAAPDRYRAGLARFVAHRTWAAEAAVLRRALQRVTA